MTQEKTVSEAGWSLRDQEFIADILAADYKQ
jgi:hypothetical protein